jgi:phage terminase small subunit
VAAKQLSAMQKMFVEAYLRTFNATQAAKDAGYSEDSAYSQGSRLLKNAEIAARVRERLQEAAMSADEVLYHLREIALGLRADVTDSDGKIDPEKVKKANKSHLIKSLRQRTFTTEDSESFESELETYDRIKALELLGKHLGMFSTVKIEDWRTQAIADIRAGRIQYPALAEAFDDSLAAQLFAAAGVPISAGESEATE